MKNSVYELITQSPNISTSDSRAIRRMLYSSKLKISRVVKEFEIRRYGTEGNNTWSDGQMTTLEVQGKVQFMAHDRNGNEINVTIEKHPLF